MKVEGVDGIMAAYNSALQTAALSGPTLFGNVVNRAAEIASQSLMYNRSKYYVLLIITVSVWNETAVENFQPLINVNLGYDVAFLSGWSSDRDS